MLMAFIMLFVFTGIKANANLLVTQTYIMLDPKNRVVSFKLFNPTKETKTYKISIAHMKMGEDGGFSEMSEEEIVKNNLSIVDGSVMFSPKSFTIEQQQAQVIKIIGRFDKIAEGKEYMARVMFKEFPQDSVENAIEKASAAKKVEEKGLAINLKPLFNISVPLIISKVQTPAYSIDAQNFKVNYEENFIEFALLNNNLNLSPFGTITMQLLDEKGAAIGKELKIEKMYMQAPLAKRIVKLNFAKEALENKTISSINFKYKHVDKDIELVSKVLKL